MPSLAERQAAVARAVIGGDVGPMRHALRGGADPRKRLGVHVRHYEASLAEALLTKFPATRWLAGSQLVTEAARAYARAHPPTRPCIAEYGREFPSFVAGFGWARELAYLRAFAELEWAVAESSIAIDLPPLAWTDVARVGVDELLSSTLRLQPGLRYRRASWAVDELLTMYLRGAETERFVLPRADTCVEVRGARGEIRIARLDGASFAFRSALAAQRSIAEAAERALERDANFDAGAALRELVGAGLATRLLAAA